MIRVAILAYGGVLQTTLGVTLDILTLANRIAAALEPPRGSRFELKVLGVRRRAVPTGAGHVFHADATISARPAAVAEVVLVPGMNLPTPQLLLPALASREAAAASAWLRSQWLAGATVGASCTGTFLLAEAGLLDGRLATTSWFLAPLFRSRYPQIELRSELLLTRDNRLLCAGAAMAQADLVLAVVAERLGPTIAQRCMRYLLLDERSSQAHYALMHQLADQDPSTTRAEAWVRRHLGENFSIADLARAVTLGRRTLARRIERATGVSPIAFVQRIRVESALRLLQSTALSFDEIAARVGYLDPGALRRLLRRETGRGAREIRRKALA